MHRPEFTYGRFASSLSRVERRVAGEGDGADESGNLHLLKVLLPFVGVRETMMVRRYRL